MTVPCVYLQTSRGRVRNPLFRVLTPWNVKMSKKKQQQNECRHFARSPILPLLLCRASNGRYDFKMAVVFFCFFFCLSHVRREYFTQPSSPRLTPLKARTRHNISADPRCLKSFRSKSTRSWRTSKAGGGEGGLPHRVGTSALAPAQPY